MSAFLIPNILIDVMKVKLIRRNIARLKIYLNLPYQVQRFFRGERTRNLFSLLSANLKPNPIEHELNEDKKSNLSELESTGWSSIGSVFSDKDISQVLSKLEKYKLKDRFRPEYGEFTLDSVPPDTHVADYVIKNWLEIPEVLDLANDPQLIGLAERYLGCKPTISNMQVWWSFPGHETPEQAEFFHRDVDDWKFFKLFIYLTDVDELSGPHVYVLNSKDKERGLPIRRYQDDEIEKIFGKENIRVLTGNRGEAFIEDTFGFHKGELPKTNRRLLLQIQYSINPIGIYEYNPIKVDSNYDKYINRMYLK